MLGLDVTVQIQKVGFAKIPSATGVARDGSEFSAAVITTDEVQRAVHCGHGSQRLKSGRRIWCEIGWRGRNKVVGVGGCVRFVSTPADPRQRCADPAHGPAGVAYSPTAVLAFGGHDSLVAPHLGGQDGVRTVAHTAGPHPVVSVVAVPIWLAVNRLRGVSSSFSM